LVPVLLAPLLWGQMVVILLLSDARQLVEVVVVVALVLHLQALVGPVAVAEAVVHFRWPQPAEAQQRKVIPMEPLDMVITAEAPSPLYSRVAGVEPGRLATPMDRAMVVMVWLLISVAPVFITPVGEVLHTPVLLVGWAVAAMAHHLLKATVEMVVLI
jgi:hypothetical protein